MADEPLVASSQQPGPVRVGLCGWSISMSAYVRRFPLVEDGRPSPYVLFNNLPRVGDAERFLALL